jgi:hypothetical protein
MLSGRHHRLSVSSCTSRRRPPWAGPLRTSESLPRNCQNSPCLRRFASCKTGQPSEHMAKFPRLFLIALFAPLGQVGL